MCGICGIYHLDGKPVSSELLQKMTTLIKHRGPDDEGYVLIRTRDEIPEAYCGYDSIPEKRKQYPLLTHKHKSDLGFGFRRLSIVDLTAAGHQPMSYADENLWIVFNGEIYNHVELREELKALGHRFTTRTDTEVILAAYVQWGTDCLKHFNGMWSLAIWDVLKHRLFCARDRFGVKPFYYFYDGNVFAFGSEIKQLVHYSNHKDLNVRMIYRSLKMGSFLCFEDETFYNAIKVLKNGHFLLIENGKLTKERYYNLSPETFETSSLDFKAACEQYRELFIDSVKLRMRSDVEVGSCLSGGLDSSAIVSTAARMVNHPLHTFSAYYTDPPEIDERKWIQIVNQHTGSIEHLLSPKPSDVLANLQRITWFHDLPLVGSSPVSQFYVMKEARYQGITVLLDGQGSDEITAGYNHAFYRHYADLLLSGRWTLFARDFPQYLRHNAKGNSLSKIMKTMLTLMMPEIDLYRNEVKHNLPNVITQDFSGEELFPHFREMNASKLSSFLYNLVMTVFLQTLLHFEDRNSMAWSIESRVPFLDYRLVEFAFSLPNHYKIRGHQGKYIHRQALQDIVPPEIANRKDKVNFAAPGEALWLRHEFRSFYEEMFHDALFTTRWIFDAPKIQKLYYQYLKGDNRYSSLLWKILSLEIWFRSQAELA